MLFFAWLAFIALKDLGSPVRDVGDTCCPSPTPACMSRCPACDKVHRRPEQCPYFKQARGTHEDEQVLPHSERHVGKDMPSIELFGKEHGQKDDGACLFHALLAATLLQSFVLRSAVTTMLGLRGMLLDFLEQHAKHRVATPGRNAWLRNAGSLVPNR